MCKHPTPVPKFGGSHAFVHSHPKMFSWWQSFKEQQQRGGSSCWICFCHSKSGRVFATDELVSFEEAAAKAVFLDSCLGLSSHPPVQKSTWRCANTCARNAPLVACWLQRITFLRLLWVAYDWVSRHEDTEVLANTFHSFAVRKSVQISFKYGLTGCNRTKMLSRNGWLKRQKLPNETFHAKLKTKLGARSSPLDSKRPKGP